MRNPIHNAWHSLLHNRRHIVFAIFRRIPWIIPNDELYLKIYYWLSLRKPLNLKNPVLFNEKLQWLKLYDRRPEYTELVDKYAVKEFVSKKIGEEYVIPVIKKWNNPSEIVWDDLPNSFVLKTNHDGGSNGIVICKDKSKLDRKKAMRELKHSFYRSSYMIGREWPYKNIKKCVFAEEYMEDTKSHELTDYKFFCFNGVPKVLLIATERNSGNTKMDFFDMDFNDLNITEGHPNSKKQIIKPESFELMKKIAAKLSEGIPHVRLDLYEVDGKVYFGEYTFSDSGGTGEFKPEKWDRIFGDWITLPSASK